MGVSFYGNGSCYIPKTHSFIRFIDGVYTTSKAVEIECLAAIYKHDVKSEEVITDEQAEYLDKPKRVRRSKGE